MLFPLHNNPEVLAKVYHETFENITNDFPDLPWEKVTNKKDLIAVAKVIQAMLDVERNQRDKYLIEYYKIVGAEEARKKE